MIEFRALFENFFQVPLRPDGFARKFLIFPSLIHVLPSVLSININNSIMVVEFSVPPAISSRSIHCLITLMKQCLLFFRLLLSHFAIDCITTSIARTVAFSLAPKQNSRRGVHLTLNLHSAPASASAPVEWTADIHVLDLPAAHFCTSSASTFLSSSICAFWSSKIVLRTMASCCSSVRTASIRVFFVEDMGCAFCKEDTGCTFPPSGGNCTGLPKIGQPTLPVGLDPEPVATGSVVSLFKISVI